MVGTVEAAPFRNKSWPLRQFRGAVQWCRRTLVSLRSRRRFTFRRYVYFGTNPDIRPPNFACFGHHVSIGKNFTCEVDLLVGNFVLISSNVSVIGQDHPFDDPNSNVFTQPRIDKSKVEIGNDVLIGFGSILIGDVSIGDGCIVGAGSVVARDLPPYTVCAGVPARPIRDRYSSGGSTN